MCHFIFRGRVFRITQFMWESRGLVCTLYTLLLIYKQCEGWIKLNCERHVWEQRLCGYNTFYLKKISMPDLTWALRSVTITTYCNIFEVVFPKEKSPRCCDWFGVFGGSNMSNLESLPASGSCSSSSIWFALLFVHRRCFLLRLSLCCWTRQCKILGIRGALRLLQVSIPWCLSFQRVQLLQAHQHLSVVVLSHVSGHNRVSVSH
jgi:hypothetical protein